MATRDPSGRSAGAGAGTRAGAGAGAGGGDSAADLLTGGAAERLRPRSRWPAALLALLVLLVLAGALADRREQRHEGAALARCLAEAEGTVAYHDRRIGSVVDYASPQLTAAGTRTVVRRSLEGLVQQAARDGLVPLSAARARCASVRVLPWHRAALRAREAVSTYLLACERRLRQVSADVAVLGRRDVLREERRAEADRRLRALGTGG